MFVNNLAKGRKLMRNLISIAIVAAAAAGIPATIASAQSTPAAAAAKPSPPPEAALALEAGEGRAVATKLADELVKSFVFTDQAEAYAAMLRKNAAGGRYDNGTRGELAKLMTDDLLAVHRAGHQSRAARNAAADPVRHDDRAGHRLHPVHGFRRKGRRGCGGPQVARREQGCEDADLRSSQPPWRWPQGAGCDFCLHLREANPAGDDGARQVGIRRQ